MTIEHDEGVHRCMLYNEDCRSTLKRMANNSVDCVITSPPYNMNLRIRKGKYCSRQIVKEMSNKYQNFDDNLPIDVFYGTHKEILSELIRVSGLVFYNISIVTGSKRAFFKLIGDFSDNLKDVVVWDKGHGEPAIQQGVLNRASELILIFENSDLSISRRFSQSQFNRGELSDIWRIPRGKKLFPNHGAVFPKKLVEKICENFTQPEDLIYDPFTGTGTVGAVCKEMGRKFIGSEITREYYDIANERIQQGDE